MTRPRVVVTAPLPGQAVPELEKVARVAVHSGPALTDPGDLAEVLAEADAAVTLLDNPVTETVLEDCPSLRVVANCAVGYDNVDVAAASRRQIWVTHTPDVLTEATADLTWGLILAVTRRLGEAERLLRAGRWRGWRLDLLLGTGLQGARLGILGLGRIGRAVARRAGAFKMEVVATTRTRRADPEFEIVGLDELLRSSDVVSVHLPLTAETRHLLDTARLLEMRPGAVLVNTARGPIVDEAALVDVLQRGHLAGAGLDVFEHEPRVHPGLLEREDVVLLPHIGSATRQTRAAMAELAARNVVAVLEGREPPTPVPTAEMGRSAGPE